MSEPRKCTGCGAELPPDAPGGHCPQCLLKLAGLGGKDETPATPAPTIRVELAPEVASSEKPGDSIGKYKLLQLIGEGGMGAVWMAEQTEPVRRKVAVKVVKLGMDTKQVVARFEAERQALALMDHPNIAKVLDAGAAENGRPYFVMELVRGIRITDYCDQNNLSTRERLGLFVSVCSAIQHAHQKGIIHRDIKPSNILVTMNDGVPVPKVIDFGIAKATTDLKLTDKTLFTAFEQFIGTPAYMSPEQAEMSAIDIDTRSDIYSLGVLLYELLTGKTPFDARELVAAGLDAMRRVIREIEPPKPSTRLSTMREGELTTTAKHRKAEAPKLVHLIRGDLDWIVMKTLEKDRTRRYETANGLAADLRRFLDNEPVTARPPSQLYRLQKTVKRHKVVFAALGAVVAVLVIGFIVSAFMYVQEKAARRRAVTAEQRAGENERKAVRAATRNQQITGLFKGIFRAAGPSVALGNETNRTGPLQILPLGNNTEVLQILLERASASVHAEFKNQPEDEAEFCNVIGEVYQDLGQFSKAEEMHRRALELQLAIFGSENTNTATSMDDLGQALREQNKFEEAEKFHRDALDIRKKLLGPQSSEVANSMNNLGIVLWARGKLQDAVDMHQATLAMRRRLFGKQHADIANSLNNLGIALRDHGDFKMAEDIHREALAMRRSMFGTNHPDVAVSLNNLASVLWNEQKFAEATTVQREALAVQLAIYGEKHPAVANSYNNLATDLFNLGQVKEAEEMQRKALALQIELWGRKHEQVARSMNNIAYMLSKQGKWPEAEAMNRDALAMRRDLLGDGHTDTAQSMYNLALVLREEKKFIEAETWHGQALAIRRKVLSKQHPDLAASLDNLAVVLADQGKFEEAAGLERECLDIRRVEVPDDWWTFNSMSRLGGDLLGQQKPKDAESLLVEGYGGMKSREARIPVDRRVRLREAIERLVRLYHALGQLDREQEWQSRLADFDKAEIVRSKT